MKPLIIASRGSQLALWQAEHVKSRMQTAHPHLNIEILRIKTKGDIILDVPLAKVGGKGLFVKEIEEALLDGSADLAVHSMKDVPMELPSGLTLGCIPEREIPADMFLSTKYADISSLPTAACIGTSSLRRQSQLLGMRPDLNIVPLRGNIDTRLRKLMDGEYDAIILAGAGVNRLKLQAPYMHMLSVHSFIPAVGQGALGIECRTDRQDILDILTFMEHRSTRICVEAERGFLAGLEGGCQVPIAGHATMTGHTTFTLQGLVAKPDGCQIIRDQISGTSGNARAAGLALAHTLLARGAAPILEQIYKTPLNP